MTTKPQPLKRLKKQGKLLALIACAINVSTNASEFCEIMDAISPNWIKQWRKINKKKGISTRDIALKEIRKIID